MRTTGQMKSRPLIENVSLGKMNMHGHTNLTNWGSLFKNSFSIILLCIITLSATDFRKKDSLALVAIRQANPDSVDFDWRFRQKLDNWKGVVVSDNRVRELSLRHCEVDTLPPEIGLLTALESLDLSNPISRTRKGQSWSSYMNENLLTELPEEIGTLVNLRILNLEGNHIQVLPKGFYQLRMLEELNLSYNGPWSSHRYRTSHRKHKDENLFSPEVKNLVHLKSLNISNGDIKRVPINLKYVKSLEILSFISTEIRSLHSLDTLPELRELHLRRSSVRWLSPLDRFPKLEVLDLSIAHHDTLPGDIHKLSQLKRLDLSYNYGIVIPEALSKLHSLEELNVASCHLYKQPQLGRSAIFKVPNLKRLILRNNGLGVIPSEISQLQSVTDLILSGNRLSTLPSELALLSNLHYLDLSYNDFDTLPAVLEKLEACRLVDVGSNKIRFNDVPLAIRKMDMKVKRNDVNFEMKNFTLPPFLGWTTGEDNRFVYGIRGGPLFTNRINRYGHILSPQVGYYGYLNQENHRQLLYVGGSYILFEMDVYSAMGLAVNGGYVRGRENGESVEGGRVSLQSHVFPFIPCGIELALSSINRQKQFEILIFFSLRRFK